jgi:hypothetical protein
MIASTRALLTCPGSHFRPGLGRGRARVRPTSRVPGLPGAPARRHGGKGQSTLSPAPPIPAPAGAQPSKKEIDRRPRASEPQPAFGTPPHPRLFTAPPQNTSPRALCRTTRACVTPPVATPSSKSVAKITTPSLTQTCRQHLCPPYGGARWTCRPMSRGAADRGGRAWLPRFRVSAAATRW